MQEVLCKNRKICKHVPCSLEVIIFKIKMFSNMDGKDKHPIFSNSFNWGVDWDRDGHA